MLRLVRLMSKKLPLTTIHRWNYHKVRWLATLLVWSSRKRAWLRWNFRNRLTVDLLKRFQGSEDSNFFQRNSLHWFLFFTENVPSQAGSTACMAWTTCLLLAKVGGTLCNTLTQYWSQNYKLVVLSIRRHYFQFFEWKLLSYWVVRKFFPLLCQFQ